MMFFICEKCGNLVGMIQRSGVSMKCCGQNMTELIPGITDGASEKHVPVYTMKDHLITVVVGSVEHPMEEEHYISWIAIETAKGAQRKVLKPGDHPCADFAVTDDDTVLAVYAYCNLHGLWKSVYTDFGKKGEAS